MKGLCTKSTGLPGQSRSYLRFGLGVNLASQDSSNLVVEWNGASLERHGWVTRYVSGGGELSLMY